ncbi:ARO1 [Acrasis kona]|uniref:ARO1 n=1 Tax=Acrasis kona TaxID=1008807 RepID=A0AAW2YV70_9EUKA
MLTTVRKNVQRVREVEDEWRKSSAAGYEVFKSLIQLTIEQQYMESPYWGVFSHCEIVKDKVSANISQQSINYILALHNIIESKLVVLCDEVSQIVAKIEKLRYDLINQALGQEKLIENVSVFDKIVVLFKSVSVCFHREITVKKLLLSEIKQMISESKYGEEEQGAVDNEQDEEGQNVVLNHTTLQLYEQTWRLDAHLSKNEKHLSEIDQLILNRTL